MHEVRLRGGWLCEADESIGRTSIRLTLPAPPHDLPAGRLRLIRRFQRPPRIEDEPAGLRLRRVSGIRSITLNGRPLGPISPDRFEYDWPLGVLEPSNELVIVADPVAAGDTWGLVSLIFGGSAPEPADAPPAAPAG
jgi:hypothetical protein